MHIRLLIHLFLAAIVTLAACVSLHLIADPYDIYGTRKIEGFNKVKAVIGSKQRVFETVELLRRTPEAIIFGTSRSDIGIDPAHKAFAGLSSFNAAASGQQITETRELLAAVLQRASTPPKRVVVGLDFMGFNAFAPLPFDYSRDNFDRARPLELLFSISTTLDSIRTLQRQNYDYQLGQGGLLRDDGFRSYNGNPALTSREQFLGSEEGYLRDGYKPPPHCAWSATDPVAKRDLMEDYRQLLRLAYDAKLDMRLFISPSHARQWETLAAAGLWPQWEAWKRDLTRINAEEAARAKLPAFALWDFSGYSSITTETVPAKAATKYYWESSHYHKELGDLVLGRLFGLAPTPPADFGRALTPATIDAWLAETRTARARYRASHAGDIADIATLAKKQAASSACGLQHAADHLDPARKPR